MIAAPLAVTVGETAPQADCGHDTVQATPIFAESLVTVALKLAVARTCTVADVWESDTLMVDDVLELPPPPHPATRAVKTQIAWKRKKERSRRPSRTAEVFII